MHPMAAYCALNGLQLHRYTHEFSADSGGLRIFRRHPFQVQVFHLLSLAADIEAGYWWLAQGTLLRFYDAIPWSDAADADMDLLTMELVQGLIEKGG